MKNFTVESRYPKLSNELRAVIRFIKAPFYRPNYQNLLMYPVIKRLDPRFVSKHAAEPLKYTVEVLKHSAKLLKHLTELLRI